MRNKTDNANRNRSDDIINVAAHRFSTSSIEQAVTAHPAIAECAVVGIPDELKGHVPFAFCNTSNIFYGEECLCT